MMISLTEAKEKVSDKYGFTVIEELDLGLIQGETIKGEARPSEKEIVTRADLDDTMKLITIAHEAGHLIDYEQSKLQGGSLKVETKAWLNGLFIAIEMGILNEYVDYWKIHLEKLK